MPNLRKVEHRPSRARTRHDHRGRQAERSCGTVTHGEPGPRRGPDSHNTVVVVPKP
jgi:hypothetical protein